MLSRKITIIVGTVLSLIALVAMAISGLAGRPRLTTQAADHPRPSCEQNDKGCVRFAVIGDFGDQTNDKGKPDDHVAAMVKKWSPQFIITVGDDNYPCGTADTIVDNVERYCDYIYNPGAVAIKLDKKDKKDKKGKQVSAECSGTATTNQRNAFFPTLGNHEWFTANAEPYFKYFTKIPLNTSSATTQPNQRYYDFTWETRDGKSTPVHFFALDSEDKQALEDFKKCKVTVANGTFEPDGATVNSKQYNWYKHAIQQAQEPWKITFFHHAPYACKGGEKDAPWMQWDFEDLGSNVVLDGHKHIYQRFARKDSPNHPYITNGTSGTKLAKCGAMKKEDFVKQEFITHKYGALLAEATSTTITFYYYTLDHPSDSNNTLSDWVQVTKNSGGGQTMTCKGC